MGAAGGEDGSARLLPAVLVGTLQERMDVSALQQCGAARGVCHGVNGCVDTTQAVSSLHCLSQLKLLCDAAA